MQIPNSISMGPYDGKITFPGQIQRCCICSLTEHQIKDYDIMKYWKCCQHGHKGKECTNVETFNNCGTPIFWMLQIMQQQKQRNT